MKIAYLILVHKNPSQLQRLINRLNNKDTTFIIHIDKKVDKNTLKSFFEIKSRYKNIILIRNRIKVYWGSFSVVKATLECIKTLFEEDIKFDYAVLLSGEHYPIKSNKEIINFLNKNKDKSFLEYTEIPALKNNRFARWENQRGGLDRIERWHFHIKGFYLPILPSKHWIIGKTGILIKRLSPNLYLRLKKRISKNTEEKVPKSILIKRKFPFNLKLYGGCQWWIFSKELTEYCMNFSEKNKKLIKFFNLTSIPDEIFFHTIVLNSKYKKNIINKKILFEKWGKNRAHPQTLTNVNFKEIKRSKYFFARKFEINKDSEILDWIDKKILNRDEQNEKIK
jgi:hypothetical protein